MAILDDPRFHLPRPVKAVVRTSGTTDKVASLFAGFDGAEMLYGIQLHLQDGSRTLITRPYCWCESGSCPWCSTELDSEQWDQSAHTFLQAAEPWAQRGFVQGHGAPNLWYRDSALGVDARVWWYKYIGRSMQMSIHGPVRHLHDVVEAARPMVVQHLGGLLPNLWSDR